MKLLKVKGVVIAEKIVSDFDKIVTILTPNIRKNRSCSKGSRRPRSLLLGATQFLCFGEYLYIKVVKHIA